MTIELPFNKAALSFDSLRARGRLGLGRLGTPAQSGDLPVFLRQRFSQLNQLALRSSHLLPHLLFHERQRPVVQGQLRIPTMYEIEIISSRRNV